MTVESELVHDNPWNPASRFGGWEWRKPHRGEHYRTCSFCGSIHPDDLAAEVASTRSCLVCAEVGWEAHFSALAYTTDHAYTTDGWYANWADRKYGWPHKFYVEGVANRDPKSVSVMSATTHVDGATGGGWVFKEHLTRAQKKIIKDDGWSGDNYVAYQFYHKENHFAKFYTEHLRDPAISDETKAVIARISGIRFTWLEDGRVSWKPYVQEEPDTNT